MKKVLVALLLLATIVFNSIALASCSNKKSNNGKFVYEAGMTYDGSEVTITFSHTMGQNLRDVLDKYIAKFNDMYPNIHIEHTQDGGYDDVRDKISTELTVGNQPNIAYCYPDHVALYNLAGAVVTLDDLINSTATVTRKDGTTETLGFTQAQLDDFIDAYYEEGRAFGDGKMYTLPMVKSTEVLYYNVDFFKEHNLTVPTTWDEMETLCQKILEIDPNCVPLGYDSEPNWFITMCEQYGSDYTTADDTADSHFLFNNEKNREFVERFSEWHSKGYVTTQEIYGSYTSGLFTTTDSGKTKSYMSIGSSAGATHQRPTADEEGNYPFEVGIATIPQVDASNPKVISQGPSLCIFNGHSDQETIASWLFVKYLTSCVDFQAEFGMASGYVPVIESVSQNEKYASFMEGADGYDNVAALSAKVCLEQKDAYYVSPAFNGSSDARDEVGALLQKCMVEYAKATDKKKMIADNFATAVANCEYKQ